MYQLSIFDGEKPFKIDKPIRLITLFSGYDSQALALKYTEECKEKGQGFAFKPNDGGGDCTECDDVGRTSNGRQLCCIISDYGKRF